MLAITMLSSASLPGVANKALVKREGNGALFVCAQLGLKGRQAEGSSTVILFRPRRVMDCLGANSSFLFTQAKLLSALAPGVARMAGSEEVHIINTLPSTLIGSCC